MKEGVLKAFSLIESGEAKNKFEMLIKHSQSF